MSNGSKKGLGRGLSALFGDDEEAVNAAAAGGTKASGAMTVPLASLEPCPFQPRRFFKTEPLNELVASIKAHGVLQPLLVRPSPNKNNGYQIVAGERRWRAAQKAGVHELPIVVRDLSDRDVLEIALIENLQRENLQPMEEADTYHKLIDKHGYTQEDLSRIIGKSRSHIANMMRLLALPDGVKDYLVDGRLSIGHARALVGHLQAQLLADKIVRDKLNVRAAEKLAAAPSEPATKQPKKPSANVRALEEKLTQSLGWKVMVDSKPNGSGRIVIPYASLDQLDALLSRLGR